MAGKRSTTPLFELLQQSRANAVEPRDVAPSPPPVTEPVADDPAPRPEPAESQSPPHAHADSPIRIAGGIVQMPLAFAGVAVAVALAGVLGAWTLGYNRGEATANAAWFERYEGEDPPVIRELDQPLSDADSGSDRGAGGGSTAEQPPSGPPTFLVNGVASADEPRLDRHNYLQLGSFLRLSDVRSASKMLDVRGIDSIAVVDRGTLRRNDGPLYVMFAGLGFPSGEADSEQARRYRAQVLAAGVEWKASGGVKNFDDANWMLYRP